MLLAWRNLIDTATVQAAAGSELAALSADNIKTDPPAKPWRSPLPAAQADIVFDAASSVSLLALIATNLTSLARVRLKLSNVGLGGADQLDTGLIDPGLSDLYPDLFFPLPAPVTARFLRIYAEDPALTHIDIGRVYAGPHWAPSVNYERGAALRILDATRQAFARSGALLIDALPRRRQAAFDLDLIPDDEAMAESLELERMVGLSRALVVMLDPESEPVRLSFYGRLTRVTPHLFRAPTKTGAVVRKRYMIEESLRRARIERVVPVFWLVAEAGAASFACAVDVEATIASFAGAASAAAFAGAFNTPSAQGAMAFPDGEPLYVSYGGPLVAFQVTAGGQITIDGVLSTPTSDVAYILVWNGLLYQTNIFNGWWYYQPGQGYQGWVAAQGDPRLPSVPGIVVPPAGVTVQLPSGATPSQLGAAIDGAAQNVVTLIRFPVGETLNWPAGVSKTIAGKTIVVDFNGCTINALNAWGLSFSGGYAWTFRAVTERNVSGGNLIVRVPTHADVQVGDWLKLTSEDECPGSRTVGRKCGEAMRIIAVNGEYLTFDGTPEDYTVADGSGLPGYANTIRVSKLNISARQRAEGIGSVYLVNPRLRGALTHTVPKVRFTSLYRPRLKYPDLDLNAAQWAYIQDCVECEGQLGFLGENAYSAPDGPWGYGFQSYHSKKTRVYGDDLSSVHMTKQAASTDTGANSAVAGDPSTYGTDAGYHASTLYGSETKTTTFGSHSSTAGKIHDGVKARLAGSGKRHLTIRGRHEILCDADFDHDGLGGNEATIQLYNEANEWNGNNRNARGCYDFTVEGRNINTASSIIRRRSTGPIIGTSGYSGNQLVGPVHINRTVFELYDSAKLCDINAAKEDWDGENCIVRIFGGGTRTLFWIGGTASPRGSIVTLDGWRIDLSQFTGTLNLGDVGGGHQLHWTRLEIINPNGRPVVNNIGGGTVTVFYGARDQAKDFFTPNWI